MKQLAAKVNNGLSWILFIGAQLQFALIALAFFGVAASSVHAWSGRILMLAALGLLVSALIARSSKANILLSIAVFLALPLQGMLVYLDIPQILRPLHAVNGLAIMWLSYMLAHGRYRAVAPKSTPSQQPIATPTD